MPDVVDDTVKTSSLVYNIAGSAYVFSGIAAVMSNKDTYSKIFSILKLLKNLSSPTAVIDRHRGMNAGMGTAVFTTGYLEDVNNQVPVSCITRVFKEDGHNGRPLFCLYPVFSVYL